MTDLLDWADVAAIGAFARRFIGEHPVQDAAHWEECVGVPEVRTVDVADALREAYSAGLSAADSGLNVAALLDLYHEREQEALAERDEAKRELLALEWLLAAGYEVCREKPTGRVMACDGDEDSEWHDSWTDASRARGWKP
jgi:hypothetical protein